MAPFLYAEVFNIIEVLIKCFIKKDVKAEVETKKQPGQVGVSKKFQFVLSDIDISVVANNFPTKASVPSQDKKTFRTDS